MSGEKPKVWEYLLFPLQVVLACFVCAISELAFFLNDVVKLLRKKKL